MNPLNVWLHPLGIWKISKTNALFRSALLEDISKAMREDKDKLRFAEGNDGHVSGSHIKNAVWC
jgi:hypothetical protein